jgi:hypothetical protein
MDWGSFEQVIKLRDDLVRAVSDTAVCNALFELGCLLSMASADSFDSGTCLGSFARTRNAGTFSRHTVKSIAFPFSMTCLQQHAVN